MKSRDVYYEPGATTGDSPSKLFRHREGPRQTYLNRIYTGLAGGARRPRLFIVDGDTLPVTVELEPEWIQTLRAHEGNSYVLDDCTQALITWMFRFGIPKNGRAAVSLGEHLEQGILRPRSGITLAAFPNNTGDLIKEVGDFLSLTESEITRLFPKLANIDATFWMNSEAITIQDLLPAIRTTMNKKYKPEEDLKATVVPPVVEKMSIVDAMRDLFIEEDEFNSLLGLLSERRNVILQGPPGVGKTLLAKRLAYGFIGSRDDSRVKMVQFHQSYSYEDFLQGYRPQSGGATFELMDGVFHRFCEEARNNPDQKYVFLIDEINRGNLSKIFGEVMLLLEPDKRGRDWGVSLTYSGDDQFWIPSNIYLIGMMNTADRSLAMVDYALRRRFAFYDVEPAIGREKFNAFLRSRNVGDELVRKISLRIGALNDSIRGDRDLGKGFCIGHSYFCPSTEVQLLDDAWYKRVIAYQVAPLLREYWFDKPADELQNSLDTLLRPA